MAFRATNILPEKGYDQAKKIATSLKRFSANRSADLVGGGDSDNVLGTVDTMILYKTQLNAVATIPGIGDYAKEQENDPTYDVAAEFIALLALVDAVITEVVSTFPVDGSGFLLAYTISPDGTQIPRTFNVAQMVDLRAALDAVDAGVS